MRPVLQVSKQNVKFTLSFHIPALLNTKCAEIELKLTNLLPVSTFRWIDKRRFFCCLPDCLFLSLSLLLSPSLFPTQHLSLSCSLLIPSSCWQCILLGTLCQCYAHQRRQWHSAEAWQGAHRKRRRTRERVREDKNEKKSRGRIDGEIGGLKVPVAETEATLLNPQTADDADDAAATF